MRSVTLNHGASPIRLRAVTLDHPWRWLSDGWLDLCCEPAVSLFYGAVFTGVGVVLFVGLDSWGLAALILPMVLGFALVAPAAAVGLYEVSRRLERGHEVGLFHALGAFRRNGGQIALIGLFLLIAFIVWVRLAMLEFMLFFGSQPPALDNLVGTLMSTTAGVQLLLVGGVSGAVLAALVFAMSAIAIPMLVDRPDCDAVTAVIASVEAVRANPRPMALWAFLIGMFTVTAASLFLVGLVVVLPLIGHATWHAYRDLVDGSS